MAQESAMVPTAFDLAVQTLAGGTPRYELVNLPLDVTSPLWGRIEKQYNLTIPKVGALQNYSHLHRQQQQPNGELRCCCCIQMLIAVEFLPVLP